MRTMPQERTAPARIFPSPRPGEVVEETPPSFCWLKVSGGGRYRLEIRKKQGAVVWTGETEKNYLVPDHMIESGAYEWNVTAGDMERGWWAFEIAEKVVTFPRPTASEVLNSVPGERPRHLFFARDIPGIREMRAGELGTLKRNIAEALKAGLPPAPRFHRDDHALPYREYFGRHRSFVDRDLVACALGAVLLGDEDAARHAVASLLTICDWNPAGPCSLLGAWGDEVGLSHARCLPAVYDLLHSRLSPQERTLVEQTIATYAGQCEDLLNHLDFGNNPGNSHAGRVPAYLGEAALVLVGSSIPSATLERWLTLSLDIYGSFFPYYGGPDGGWAEGVFYGSSYTKWFLPFFMAVERYSGHRFLDRPFYQKVIHYFMHFAPPGWESHPFCDGYWCKPDDVEWPGFFAQNPYRLYADRHGPGLAKEWAAGAATPEIFKLHLLDVFIPPGKKGPVSLTGPVTRTRAFPDAGFLSLHTDLENPKSDTALLARASRHGTASHQHPDQGSFALMHKGVMLVGPSGYFGRAYGTAHHREWTNSTRAHNALLVDGVGQKAKSHEPVARIMACGEKEGVLIGALDLGDAYPMLNSWTRQFVLDGKVLYVRDLVTAPKAVTLTWPLHGLSESLPGKDGAVTITRKGVSVEIKPLAGDLRDLSITDKYAVDLNEGVPQAYRVSMPGQWHLKWQAPNSARHEMVVAFGLDGADLSRDAMPDWAGLFR